MKFLVFNILVTGALAYLIIAGNPDSEMAGATGNESLGAKAQNIKERVEDKVEEAAQSAKQAYLAAERKDAKTSGEDVGTKESEDATESLPVTATPEKTPSQPADMAGSVTAAGPAPAAAWSPDTQPGRTIEPLKPASAPQVAARTQPAQPVALSPQDQRKSTVKSSGSPALSPAQSAMTAVGHDARAKTGAVKIKEGEQLMSPHDRQRELENLAEEMEMMFVRTVGE